MSEAAQNIAENNLLLDVTQSLDVGLMVVDLNYKVVMWNDFMANHHGASSQEAMGKRIFSLFDDVPTAWFKSKIAAVLQFKVRSFTTWEQRPYIFRMHNYRPFTSDAEYMYQNITFVPLLNTQGQFAYVGVLIYDVTEVAIQKLQLQKARDAMSHLAKTDALTQLFNRGHWEENLHKEFHRYQRTRQVPCLLMLDIDHFKRVNDTYGHPAGDVIIQMVANTLTETLRATDIIGRLGGEEFAVILIDTEIGSATMLANRLRTMIEETVTRFEDETIKITASFGVCELSSAIESPDQWLAIVDQALYDSKRNGRNRVSTRDS